MWLWPDEGTGDRFAAEGVLVGEDGFGNTIFRTMHELGCPFGGQGLLLPLVGSALLHKGNSLTLPFPDQGTFELCESIHN